MFTTKVDSVADGGLLSGHGVGLGCAAGRGRGWTVLMPPTRALGTSRPQMGVEKQGARRTIPIPCEARTRCRVSQTRSEQDEHGSSYEEGLSGKRWRATARASSARVAEPRFDDDKDAMASTRPRIVSEATLGWCRLWNSWRLAQKASAFAEVAPAISFRARRRTQLEQELSPRLGQRSARGCAGWRRGESSSGKSYSG
eukprot:2949837-Rhodomonas_salina.1